jgi:crossover junction endodeoxyribonuclease RuvC
MIAAIDPGKTGAIALMYDDGTVYVEDMPVFAKEINGAAIADMFRELPPTHVYTESLNAFGMGRQSAFNFGLGFGTIIGVLATLQIPYTKVSPAKWKRELGLSKDKDEARAMATRLYPANADKFKRKKDDGRAEAVLIAHWAKGKE